MAHTAIPRLLMATALASCAGFELNLRPEREIEELHVLAQETDRLTSRPRSVESQAKGEPIRIAIEEKGTGGRSRAVVLIHGVLSDRRTWRYVAGELGADHDILLVDLPGCGDSDCPAADELDAYTASWLAAHVLAGLRAQLGDRDVDLTLVGHSLGGGVILRMLGDSALRSQYRDVIDRVDGAVLLAPLDFGLAQANPKLVEIATLTDFEVTLGTMFGIMRSEVGRAVETGCADAKTMPLEEYQRLYEIMTDGARLEAAQAMLRRAVPFDDEGNKLWSAGEELVDDYANVDVPCLILWGGRDETLPSASGYRLCAQLPQARLRILRACKHSLPSEEPWFCIEWIRRFVADGIVDWTPVVELRHLPDSHIWRSGDLLAQIDRAGVSNGDLLAAEPDAATPTVPVMMPEPDGISDPGVRALEVHSTPRKD